MDKSYINMDPANRAKQFSPFAALKGYEEALSDKEAPSVDLKNQIIVPVIASFNNDGKIIPLYFAIEGIRIKIDHIKWESPNKAWGTQFRCEITLYDHVDTIDLYYYDSKRIWTMKRLSPSTDA